MQASKNEQVAHFRDDFYRDGFRTILMSLAMVVVAIGLLIVLSLYFFLHQVLPTSFPLYDDWRIQAEVPVDKPYLHAADMLQWVSTSVPQVLRTDFLNYNENIKDSGHFFTTNGWTKYLQIMSTLMGQDEVVKNKEFVKSSPLGAPVILNQGLVDGKYGWWVQMPLDVRYSGIEGNNHSTKLIVQTLVVRVSTLNNLEGVAIENMIVNRG